MNALLSEARVKVSHRPAMHLHADTFRMRNATPTVSSAAKSICSSCAPCRAQTNNGWLIFYGHDVADPASPRGCSPALLDRALEAAARRKIPALTMAEALRCTRA
jgi:hypothetical protein